MQSKKALRALNQKIISRAASGTRQAHMDMEGLDEGEGEDQEAVSKHPGWQLWPDCTKFDAVSWSIP